MRRSVAAIILREGRVLLARRGYDGPLAKLWEFPGGKIEEGESDAEALAREFLEEFGARIEPQRLLGETIFLHKGRDRSLVAWLCALASEEGLSLLEHVELCWACEADLHRLDLVDSDRGLLPFVIPLLQAPPSILSRVE
jgi:8-oxo-dGTP diphosphatase